MVWGNLVGIKYQGLVGSRMALQFFNNFWPPVRYTPSSKRDMDRTWCRLQMWQKRFKEVHKGALRRPRRIRLEDAHASMGIEFVARTFQVVFAIWGPMSFSLWRPGAAFCPYPAPAKSRQVRRPLICRRATTWVRLQIDQLPKWRVFGFA